MTDRILTLTKATKKLFLTAIFTAALLTVSTLMANTALADTTPPTTFTIPNPGTYDSTITVTLACDDGAGNGCDYTRYTLDGSEPGMFWDDIMMMWVENGTIYTAPFTVSFDTTVKYHSVDINGNQETTNTGIYTIDPYAPVTTATPLAGTYDSTVTVTLTCDDGTGNGCDYTRYTLDGSEPGMFWDDIMMMWVENGTIYTAPFTVSFDTTVKYHSVDINGNQETTNTGIYTIDPYAPVTSANPIAGTYDSTITVTLTCDDGAGNGCDYTRYTLDGSEPGMFWDDIMMMWVENGTIYTTPFTVSFDTTVKYHSVDINGNQETTNTGIYTIDPYAPVTTANPIAGTYDSTVTVTLTCDDGTGNGCDYTRYTLDGSEPGMFWDDIMMMWVENGTIYTTPFTVSFDTTVKYHSVDINGNQETTNTGLYTIDPYAPVTTANPVAGTYDSTITVTLSCDDGTGNGCDYTRYTLDGSEPGMFWDDIMMMWVENGTIYTTPFTVSFDTTVKYHSVDINGNQETTNTGIYNIVVLVLSASQTDDGTNPGTGDALPAVSRADGGSDNSNISTANGQPQVDVDYTFTITLTDESGETPLQVPTFYLAHRSNPSEGIGGDFYKYDMTCIGSTWALGKTCTATTRLGPAAVHLYYFDAVKTDGTTVRYPSSGYLEGPAISMINGYNMVSAARDLSGANLSGFEAFGTSPMYSWVSTGLDIVYSSSFSGSYVNVNGDPSVIQGTGYYTTNTISELLELGSYNDVATPTYTIDLSPGWNMIGNPYNGNVFLSDVQVQQDASAAVSWATATANNWLYNFVEYYNGSDWGKTFTQESAGGSPDAELIPWLGYWVYVRDNVSTYKLIITEPAQ